MEICAVQGIQHQGSIIVKMTTAGQSAQILNIPHAKQMANTIALRKMDSGASALAKRAAQMDNALFQARLAYT